MAERVKAEWRIYRATVLDGLDDTRDHVQLMETRKAFYAGAASFYGITMKQLSPGSEPTDGDVAMMQGLEDELTAFAAAGGEPDGKP